MYGNRVKCIFMDTRRLLKLETLDAQLVQFSVPDILRGMLVCFVSVRLCLFVLILRCFLQNMNQIKRPLN